MRFPLSERLGIVAAPDGQLYTMRFYGEDEGAAVITGPMPTGGLVVEVPEVHREPADDAADARAKLDAWRIANNWPLSP